MYENYLRLLIRQYHKKLQKLHKWLVHKVDKTVG